MTACTNHRVKLGLFAALSAGDALMTYALLSRGGGLVYESNPVAAWWLQVAGWSGLVAFKAVAVLFAAGLCLVIARSRPALGGRLLTFACALVGGVLVYSSLLAGYAHANPDRAAIVRALAEEERLIRKKDEAHVYTALMDRLGEDLSAGKLSLAEAAGRLERSEKGQDPEWQRMLRTVFPHLSYDAGLAASLVCLADTSYRKQDPEFVRRLEDEFRSTYRAKPPTDRSSAGQPAARKTSPQWQNDFGGPRSGRR